MVLARLIFPAHNYTVFEDLRYIYNKRLMSTLDTYLVTFTGLEFGDASTVLL